MSCGNVYTKKISCYNYAFQLPIKGVFQLITNIRFFDSTLIQNCLFGIWGCGVIISYIEFIKFSDIGGFTKYIQLIEMFVFSNKCQSSKI